MKREFTRIAVKIGSNVLAQQDGTLDITRTSALIDQIVALHKAGMEITLISSGTVASGRSGIHTLRGLDSVDQRRLFSAVGQAKLINRYYRLSRDHGIAVSQTFTTKEDFSTRRHYLDQRSCMAVMLEGEAIPIASESDTIFVTELMFTDNDGLSGFIALMVDAQALIVLSNIDGICSGSPADPASFAIWEIGRGKNLANYIQTNRSSFGRGGVLVKTNIVRKVADEGITVIIANGKRDNILINLTEYPEKTIYTHSIPAPWPAPNIKKWVVHSESFVGREIHISEQTSEALDSDKVASILPIGITHIEREFEKNDIARVVGNQGASIDVGRTNYDSIQARNAIGKHGKEAVVHYDYLCIG